MEPSEKAAFDALCVTLCCSGHAGVLRPPILLQSDSGDENDARRPFISGPGEQQGDTDE